MKDVASDERPIFVFGSNLLGQHGRGAALDARMQYGAVYGAGVGRTGHAYAIPTKVTPLVALPLDLIRGHVRDFIDYAKEHPELEFQVTRVGCGLAGYTDADIAPMFVGSPKNCQLPVGWRITIGRLAREKRKTLGMMRVVPGPTSTGG